MPIIIPIEGGPLGQLSALFLTIFIYPSDILRDYERIRII